MKKTQISKTIILLTGICFLIPQIWYTIESFIKKETTFTVSKETFDKMVPPTILVCPQNQWDNGLWTEPKINNSDKELFLNQFFLLNENLNLSIARHNSIDGEFNFIISNLTLGDNIDEIGQTFLVEEFFNPISGMCYAMTPNHNFKLSGKDSVFIFAVFQLGEEIPPVAVFFLNSEDRYGMLFPDIEFLEPFAMLTYPSTFMGIQYHKTVANYLPSKRNCKDKYKEGSYTKCVVKNQVDCYRINGPKNGCNCIPHNTMKTYFGLYPLNSWNLCQTNSEYRTCFDVMYECFYHKMVNEKCPKPCERVVYKGMGGVANGFPTSPNMITIKTKFSTMDVDYQDEVWVQETHNFIGTVGGSLGLFIGFSVTGFIEKILGHFMKGSHKTDIIMGPPNYSTPATT